MASKHFYDYASDTPNIRFIDNFYVFNNFRRHIRQTLPSVIIYFAFNITLSLFLCQSFIINLRDSIVTNLNLVFRHHQHVTGFQIFVKNPRIVQIFQTQQNTFRNFRDGFLRKGAIFLYILLQSSLLGQFHDDRNFLFRKIDLVILRYLLVSQLLKSIDELPRGGLHLLKIGIRPKLINNLIRVLFFIKLKERFIDTAVMTDPDELAPFISIIRWQGNSFNAFLRCPAAHSLHLLVIKFIISSNIIIRTLPYIAQQTQSIWQL